MSEDSFVGYVVAGLQTRAQCYVTKHNDLSEGIPDLSVTLRVVKLNTWIELKATERWPARANTRIFWDHYTEHQALFLRRRLGWLFVRVGTSGVRPTYALFTGATAWRMWEARGFPRAEFLAEAHRSWHSGVNWLELVEALLL